MLTFVDVLLEGKTVHDSADCCSSTDPSAIRSRLNELSGKVDVY